MLRSLGKTVEARPPPSVEVDALERSAALRLWVRGILRSAVQALAFVALVLVFFFRVPGVEGRSMQPNIEGGNHVLISTLAYHVAIGPFTVVSRQINRGDVIAFERGQGDDRRIFLKRLIALPGERVALISGSVVVNGKALPEAYDPLPDRSTMPALTVPAGAYFVLGDNRAESDDSRSFGPVLQSQVIGKALLVIWPLVHVKQIR